MSHLRAFFCREYRDYALFGVEFLAEICQKFSEILRIMAEILRKKLATGASELQVMMNATRWSTVLMLMLQVMVKTWEWQFVNTMEATMKQVERTQRRNAELKLDLTEKREELRMVEIELGKKTENLEVLKRGEFLWTNESDYFAGIVG